MQASERAVARDVSDSASCSLPYFPEHNTACGAFAAIQAGNYSAAITFAETLRNAASLFPVGTVSAGEDVVTLMEVHLQFGRCALDTVMRARPQRAAAHLSSDRVSVHHR